MTKNVTHQWILALLLLLLTGTLGGFVWMRHAGEPRHDDAQVRDEALRTMLTLHPDDFTTYTHPRYGFSFFYPKSFTLTSVRNGDHDMTIVKHPSFPMGFAIRVKPWADASALTLERMRAEAPGLTIGDVRETFTDQGIPAIRFSSEEKGKGETREAWFVREGYLYRITMYHPDQEWLDAWIREVLNTDLWFGDASPHAAAASSVPQDVSREGRRGPMRRYSAIQKPVLCRSRALVRG